MCQGLPVVPAWVLEDKSSAYIVSAVKEPVVEEEVEAAGRLPQGEDPSRWPLRR